MKRFEFSLNKLLNYKDQVLKKEKNDLANLRKQQQQAIDEKHEMIGKLKHSNEDFVIKSNFGMTPQHIALAKSYMNSLSEQIRSLERIIVILEGQIEKQLGVVIEATKEVSSLEKLQEKQLEEYKKEFQKAEETFIGEYVSNIKFYK